MKNSGNFCEQDYVNKSITKEVSFEGILDDCGMKSEYSN